MLMLLSFLGVSSVYSHLSLNTSLAFFSPQILLLLILPSHPTRRGNIIRVTLTLQYYTQLILSFFYCEGKNRFFITQLINFVP